MAATIEKAKQDDPKELRRQLAEMKRELAAKPGWAVERIEVPLFDKASFEELQRNISDHIVLALNNSKGSLHVYMSKALQSAGAKPGALLGAERRSVRELPARQSAARQSPVRQSAARQSEARTSKDDDGLGAGEELVLCAIAQYPDGVTHDQLAVLTGYKERTRQTYVARLSNPGFITRSGRRFLITDAGKAKLPAGFKPLPTGTELRDHWLQTLPDGERKLLELLLDAYPKSLHMSEIQTATSYAERSVQTYAHRMAAKCVIERAGRGEIRAAKELFE
jgi:hypothetical protein